MCSFVKFVTSLTSDQIKTRCFSSNYFYQLKFVSLDMVNLDFALPVHVFEKTCLNIKIFISSSTNMLLVQLENTFWVISVFPLLFHLHFLIFKCVVVSNSYKISIVVVMCLIMMIILGICYTIIFIICA